MNDDKLFYILKRCLLISQALAKAGLDIDDLNEINQVVSKLDDNRYIAIPFRRGISDRFDLMIPLESIRASIDDVANSFKIRSKDYLDMALDLDDKDSLRYRYEMSGMRYSKDGDCLKDIEDIVRFVLRQIVD